MDASPLPTPSSSGVPFEENLLAARKPLVDDARFDITAMVDLVFMMNIFFLVSWIGAALAEIDLPAARHCVATDADTSTVLTVKGSAGETPSIYVGDARPGGEINAGEVEQRISEAVEAGMRDREGKTTVLIKAERDVCLRDVARIAGLATALKGVKLNLAVMEKD
jgi:biopolymer transport protein ExbD